MKWFDRVCAFIDRHLDPDPPGLHVARRLSKTANGSFMTVRAALIAATKENGSNRHLSEPRVHEIIREMVAGTWSEQ